MFSDTDSLAALSDSSYDTDLAASSDSDDDCSDIEFDPDGEIVDMEDEYDLPDFSYVLMIHGCNTLDREVERSVGSS